MYRREKDIIRDHLPMDWGEEEWAGRDTLGRRVLHNSENMGDLGLRVDWSCDRFPVKYINMNRRENQHVYQSS